MWCKCTFCTLFQYMCLWCLGDSSQPVFRKWMIMLQCCAICQHGASCLDRKGKAMSTCYRDFPARTFHMRLLSQTHLASKLSSIDPLSHILDKLDMGIVYHFAETLYHLSLCFSLCLFPNTFSVTWTAAGRWPHVARAGRLPQNPQLVNITWEQ